MRLGFLAADIPVILQGEEAWPSLTREGLAHTVRYSH